MDAAADHSYFIAHMLGEMFFNIKPSSIVRPVIEVHMVTDCKSLYDCLLRWSPSIQDKRTLIELASIRELISQNGIRWLPTYLMRADALTKYEKGLSRALLDWLQSPTIALVDVSMRSES